MSLEDALVEAMTDSFSLEELSLLCINLGIDPDGFVLGKADKALYSRQIVIFARRRGQMETLIRVVRGRRPHSQLPEFDSVAVDTSGQSLLAFPQSPESAKYDLIKLREIIARSDFTDLRVFCADLKEDYNSIVGEGKTAREAALALVKYFDNRGRVGELVERVRREFPSAEWGAVFLQESVPPPSPFASAQEVKAALFAPAREVKAESSPKASRIPGPLRVFLCHASPDKDYARALYKYLKDIGVEPWLDEEDLVAGQDWRKEIRRAVERSDVVLVCLSQYVMNREGFIRDEIGYVLNEADRQAEGTIFVVPLRLDNYAVPERIARWHWINWFDTRNFEQLRRALYQRARQLEVVMPSLGVVKEIPKPQLVSASLPKTEVRSSAPIDISGDRRILLVGIGLMCLLILSVTVLVGNGFFKSIPLVATATRTIRPTILSQSPVIAHTPQPTSTCIPVLIREVVGTLEIVSASQPLPTAGILAASEKGPTVIPGAPTATLEPFPTPTPTRTPVPTPTPTSSTIFEEFPTDGPTPTSTSFTVYVTLPTKEPSPTATC